MKLTGEKISLRPMSEADMALRVRWFNDPEVNKTLILDETLYLDKTIDWFKRAISDDSRRDFLIETLDEKPIGFAGLVGIDHRDKIAEIYIVIGEKEYWGKGVMAQAESLLIKWGFETLNLHKIWAQARPMNVASIITMKKLGFQIEGTLRQERYIAGEWIDVIRAGLLRDEFRPAGGAED